MKIIGILNQKGGVAKTTTASALAYGLVERGKKVLMVDMDAQSNLTSLTGVNPESTMISIYEILSGKASAKEALVSVKEGMLDILPSTPDVAMLDIELSSKIRREYLLAKKLEEIKADYDYIVIDTPPALGLLTINAMVACDYVIIPTDTAAFSMKGMMRLAETLEGVSECNENLKILGVLIVKNKANTKLSKILGETIAKMVDQFHTTLFNSRIREQVAVSESQLYQENVLDYIAETRKPDKEDAGTDYEKFVDEVLERIGDK